MAIFIYARYTPKGIRLFPSEQVCVPGGKVRMMDRSHADGPHVQRALNAMIGHIKASGRDVRMPLKNIAEGAQVYVAPYMDLVYLPATPQTAQRVLLKIKES
jgi:rhamnogalacturonyl hydrolase YesR